MYVEYAACAPPPRGAAGAAVGDAWTHGGRTYCWMGAAQMGEVGVTAGVLKVIAAVDAATSAKGAATKAPARGGKRAAAAAVAADAKQPKLSSFFTPKSTGA